MGAADVAWRVLTRDVERLQQEYVSGQWLPYPEEMRFAEGLARIPWGQATMEAAMRLRPVGRLGLLLENAIFVLRYVEGRDPALLRFRQLVDVLADDAEKAAAARDTGSGHSVLGNRKLG
ncbi:hypothetical protein ACFY12_34390 [Streptomyces sp. NPDC001339]|uniref:hypothetical protein n=1 Tax=Streptomyces sp. NPDC001339 TaxID=3364563 RepID=UPI003675D3F8